MSEEPNLCLLLEQKLAGRGKGGLKVPLSGYQGLRFHLLNGGLRPLTS